LFPGLKADRVGNDELKELIVEDLEKNGYKHNEETVFEDQVNKTVQLYETMETRHTTMVVGPTGSGKTVVIKTLGKALEEQSEVKTKIDVMNPKMVTGHELYGVLDPVTRDWTDGLLSKIFKAAN
jgi:dynein heavy chain